MNSKVAVALAAVVAGLLAREFLRS